MMGRERAVRYKLAEGNNLRLVRCAECEATEVLSRDELDRWNARQPRIKVQRQILADLADAPASPGEADRSSSPKDRVTERSLELAEFLA